MKNRPTSILRNQVLSSKATWRESAPPKRKQKKKSRGGWTREFNPLLVRVPPLNRELQNVSTRKITSS